MALNIQTGGGGDRKKIVKYNAKAGRMFRVDRSNDSGQWVTDDVDITSNVKFVADLANIETGWMNFPPNAAPDIRTVKMGLDYGPKPGEGYRVGFKMALKLAKDCGGDVREMTGSAACVVDSVSHLHDAYLAGLAANPGKLPVVSLKGTTPRKTEYGTNYEPVWEIISWVTRPADLPDEANTSAPAAAPSVDKPAAPATGSTIAPPPAKPQPAMATADDDFG